MVRPPNSEPKRRPGRPRQQAVDEAITAATLAVLTERGFTGLTIALVATRAGVSRPTVYRRWPGKEDLVVDALAATVPVPDPPDTGDLWQDLAVTVRTGIDGLGATPVGPVVIGVLAASAQNPVLADALAERYLRPRVGAVEALIERGVRSGVLRSDVSPAVVRDLLLGPLVYRWLISGEPLSGADAEDLGRVLAAALGAPAGPDTAG